MKILHAADIHLDASSHSRPGPDGIPTALASSTRCWQKACAIAVEQSADLMLVAGDVFHGRNPGALALNAFESGLRLLRAAGIPVVIIDGNHDGATSPELPSVLQVFDERDPVNHDEGVFVSSKPEIVEIRGLRIGTLPWVSRQYLAAQHDGITRAEASTAVIDGLQWILDAHRAQGVDVVMGHWTVEGAQLQGSEVDVSITGEAVIPVHSLEGFRYVAMGHIHKHQALAGVGTYSGSTDRLSFGEEGEPKGVYVVELDPLGVQFVETPAREFLTVIGGDRVSDVAARAEGAIVRVVDALSDEVDDWQRELTAAGALEVTVRALEDRHEIRRAADVTEAMGPLEATDRVLDLWDVEQTKRPAIREAVKEVVEA